MIRMNIIKGTFSGYLPHLTPPCIYFVKIMHRMVYVTALINSSIDV